ncbi:LacI family transcriptional regulator [Lactobacillus colini]|uniref:LacI family transcriptional regulator n=1 Tax=Lactobacillus colini TaxID=1819254 RepID=A0ABS4MG60_9LACO|nr:LacI family DNA-binding transcriptional regulator [Lactobacillus colini]MBP2058680.1 LacI family transcriptional regulator [Lactobacillus colini]
METYSIKDIAKLAGVSVATVSRVINNKGKYSQQTKEKVLRIIKETNYKIDTSAQSLRTNITHTIGILVPDIENSFFANLVQKIEEKLFEKHYSTFICNTDKNEKKEKAYLTMLENKKVDGIIVISGSYRQGFTFKSSLKSIPYICIDRSPKNINETVFISSNHKQGAIDATNYLLSRHSIHPAIIMEKKNLSTSIKARLEGFKQTLDQRHIDSNVLYYSNNHSIKEFIDIHPYTDAFFAINDNLAITAIMTLKAMKIRIPEDIQVIGFDNIPSAKVIEPSLTTISQNIEEIAEVAVENILKRIQNFPNLGQQILIATHLVKRNSTY